MSASENQDQEYEEIYEEEEVTEEEAEDAPEEEHEDNPPATPAPATPLKTPASSSAKTPASVGKVNPTSAVKNMKMKSPESSPAPAAPVAKATIKPEKNPFPTYGAWSPADISQISIEFPILTGKNESTNDLTRKSRPEARYWKAPVNFKYGNYASTTMRFNNVGVPFHTGSGYGSNYMYISLPKHVGDAFAVAGKTRAPTRVTETSLMPDSNRWWKIVNNVEGKVGVIDPTTKMFVAKSLATIFDATQNGLTLNIIVSFNCKASTDEMEQLKPTTIRTVSAELVRAFVDKTDQNIQGPIRASSNKKVQVEPTASKSDLASDDLMKRLAELGL